MNAADLARLELAKRAYQATQPSERELQTGVRRARLALIRNKPRRNWFSRGLVFVVLAVGGLAYAKPHQIGELLDQVLPSLDHSGKRAIRGGVSAATEAATKADASKALAQRPLLPARTDEATAPLAPARADEATATAPLALLQLDDTRPAVPETAPPALEPTANAQRAMPQSVRALESEATGAGVRSAAAPNVARAKKAAGRASGSHASSAPTTPPRQQAASDWGRVGQALAQGNDAAALAALSELAESDDARTRDKADLGRAQLLMAHGNADQACSLARSLTHRRAGSRIERQALAILKSCTH